MLASLVATGMLLGGCALHKQRETVETSAMGMTTAAGQPQPLMPVMTAADPVLDDSGTILNPPFPRLSDPTWIQNFDTSDLLASLPSTSREGDSSQAGEDGTQRNTPMMPLRYPPTTIAMMTTPTCGLAFVRDLLFLNGKTCGSKERPSGSVTIKTISIASRSGPNPICITSSARWNSVGCPANSHYYPWWKAPSSLTPTHPGERQVFGNSSPIRVDVSV